MIIFCVRDRKLNSFYKYNCMLAVRKELEAMIEKERPNLSVNSKKTYLGVLNKAVARVAKEKHSNNLEVVLNDTKDMLDYVKSLDKPQTRKTLCSALFILTKNQDYKTQMLDDVAIVNKFYREQKVSSSRKDEMKSYEEIHARAQQIIDAYKSNPSHQNIQDAILAYVCSGYDEALPPRRVLDYVMRIRGWDKSKESKDNYYDKGTFYFNNYKTARKYGTQTIKCPKQLEQIINKWKKLNTGGDYLFINSDGKPITSSGLAKRIKALFGASCDVLRSIFISHMYRNMPQLQHLEQVATDMGHTVSTAMNYYVKPELHGRIRDFKLV